MDYTTLGNTGLKVSRLSFGASALGGVFRNIDESDGIAAVHEALEEGIDYFDVAPAYGGTVAETVLGNALHGIQRERFVISTKAGKYTEPGAYGNDELNYSEERMRRGLEESMKRLGVDYIDIVHLHDFEYQSGSKAQMAFDEGFPALQKFKEEGMIGAVSAGIYPMDLWFRVIEEAPVDCILTHNHYSLIDTRGTELLPLCKKKNIGVINASPFASSLLTGGKIADWHPSTPEQHAVLEEAAHWCAERGTSIAKLAFQFATQNKNFHTTMFSTARVSSVKRNLLWYDEPYEEELVSGVRKILAPLIDHQWDYDAGVDNVK